MTLTKKLWIGIAILIILTPLGIIIPDHFKAGSAWGEWGKEEVSKLVGYVPAGFAKLSELWNAPMPDYSFKGWEEKGPLYASLAYIGSTAVGVLMIYLFMLLYGRFISRKGKKN